METDSLKVNVIYPRQVYLRCVFLKILKIDTVNEIYSGEIFLQAKWREPRLDSFNNNEEINFSSYWNPKVSISNIFSENKSTISMNVIFSEDVHHAYIVEKRRIRATFQETLELQHFPFDCQDLSISVQTEFSINDVELLECPHDISKLNTIDGMESQEWNLFKHVQVESNTIINDCNIGPRERQVMVFTCRATRRFAYFLINYFMISSMFFLLTFTSFSISTTNVFGRMALCMTILLTSVTFKVAVSQNLPKVPYLTYLDKAILGNIIMIMTICIWHALTSLWFLNSSASEAVERLKKIEAAIIPSILAFYGIAVSVFGLIIYLDAGKRRRKMKNLDIEYETVMNKLDHERVTCDVC